MPKDGQHDPGAEYAVQHTLRPNYFESVMKAIISGFRRGGLERTHVASQLSSSG
jgi:hypothetical protein